MSLPSTIRAIIVLKHGDFDVIELGELPFPKQASNEILIKVFPSFYFPTYTIY